jgi:hypothetical protein
LQGVGVGKSELLADGCFGFIGIFFDKTDRFGQRRDPFLRHGGTFSERFSVGVK